MGLPKLFGSPICVLAQPHLKAYRGKLVSGLNEPGMPVHAASFIRRREIYLETQLLGRPQKLRMIMAHEVFHFVWPRLGNRLRAEYSGIVKAELEAGARGEVGESSDGWKRDVLRAIEVKDGAVRNYVCESFCDTAAWLYSGVRRNAEITLGVRWRRRRLDWFGGVFGGGGEFRV